MGPGENLQYDSKTGDFSADVPVDGLTSVAVDAKDQAGNETTEFLTVIATMNKEPLFINFDNLAPSMILNKRTLKMTPLQYQEQLTIILRYSRSMEKILRLTLILHSARISI